MDNRSTYKEPVVFHSNYSPKATWRIIWYEMISPGEWKRARPTGDLNRIKNISDRLIAAKLLCKMISEALAKGWRYYERREPVKQTKAPLLIETLTTNARNKAASLSTPKSGTSYISWTRIFTRFLEERKLAHLTIDQLTPLHVQLFIDTMIEKKKSNTTINNIIRGVANIFSRIKKLHRLPYNPFKEVDKLKETESTRFEIITDTELIAISNHLPIVCPPLWLFFLHVYYGYMRPATIIQLQGKHYDFENSTIIINPTSHKNRKANRKQMLSPLRQALIDQKINSIDKEMYVFSSGLHPGSSLKTTSVAGKLWKKHVHEELKIKKNLYAGKHTGATNYLLDNSGKESIRWFQNQMGHSSLAESKAYIDKSIVVTLDESSTKIRKL